MTGTGALPLGQRSKTMPTDMTAADTETDTSAAGKLGLLPLTALAVGSMIGGGVFSLP